MPGRWRPAPGTLCAGALAGLAAWMVSQVVPLVTPLVTVEPCVAPDRPLAWLGVHLSLLHVDPHGCASGELAVGPDAAQGAWVTIMVTAPTLAMNLLTTAGAIGCWTLVHSWVAVVSGLLRRLWRAPASPPHLPAALSPPLFPLPVTVTYRRAEHSPVLRRGPPAPLAV